jgi:hypothetical protein
MMYGERHGAMRKLIYGMNLTLDGYVAAPGSLGRPCGPG